MIQAQPPTEHEKSMLLSQIEWQRLPPHDYELRDREAESGKVNADGYSLDNGTLGCGGSEDADLWAMDIDDLDDEDMLDDAMDAIDMEICWKTVLRMSMRMTWTLAFKNWKTEEGTIRIIAEYTEGANPCRASIFRSLVGTRHGSLRNASKWEC